MKTHLCFGNIETNNNFIIYPIMKIIRKILPEVKEKKYGEWKLKKESIAKLAQFTNMLLDNTFLVQDNVYYCQNTYGFDGYFECIMDQLKQVHYIFTTTLIDMVLNKKNLIYVKWRQDHEI